MYPTRHAVQRYQQRVAAMTTAEAFRHLEHLAATAKVRPTPRWWTPVKPTPGLAFAYPASEPGVCLLVRNDAILTVYERSQCQFWIAQTDRQTGEPRKVRRPYHRAPAGASLGDAA